MQKGILVSIIISHQTPICNSSTQIYIENCRSRYSSSFFLFISLLLPTHSTNGQFLSSDNALSLFIPTPE